MLGNVGRKQANNSNSNYLPQYLSRGSSLKYIAHLQVIGIWEYSQNIIIFCLTIGFNIVKV